MTFHRLPLVVLIKNKICFISVNNEHLLFTDHRLFFPSLLQRDDIPSAGKDYGNTGSIIYKSSLYCLFLNYIYVNDGVGSKSSLELVFDGP